MWSSCACAGWKYAKKWLKMSVVRLKLITNLHAFNKQIGKENTAEHVVPMLKDMTKDPKWRFRKRLLESIPNITDNLSLQEFKDL